MDAEIKKYHYTTGENLIRILKSKTIKRATAYTPKKKQQAVWFSTNPVWEETANKDLWDGKMRKSLDRFGTGFYGKGLARIRVKDAAAPNNFQDYVRLSHVPLKMAHALVVAAQEHGANPSEWYVSFKPVGERDWVDVEMFDYPTKQWVSVLTEEK
jgi:hypothetical protein